MAPTTVLGVSCLSHDAGVASVRGDSIRFASHVERYTRRKNDKHLHADAIAEALRYGGPPDLIAYYERPLLKRTRQLRAGQWTKALVGERPETYLRRFPALAGVPIRYVSHHLAHAAGGYFTSPFRDATIVVADAIGEWNTLTVWEADGRRLARRFAVDYPHSLGLFYSAFTQRVGLKPNEEEYIMMGMAAFGEPKHVAVIREDFLADVPPPRFRLKRSMHRGIRDWRPELRDVENIAASVQALAEEFLDGVFAWAARTFPSRNLVYSGGVALNCVYNGRLARSGYFDEIWIMPSPGDAGSSLGAALAVVGDWVRWEGPYLGHDIDRPLDVEGAVAALVTGNVIGVANGRAEFGPRALGNRSLLADPRTLEMKDRVNRVKRRELFRPFAPVVLEEHAEELFDMPVGTSPYMQYVARCKRPDDMAAVAHVDGTARVQTVSEDQHPLFYRLLKEFHGRTGCPALLNTSLNVRGEPLVNSWGDACRFSELYGVPIF